MDQEVFNALVLTTAWAKRIRGIPQTESDRIIQKAVEAYRTSFPRDEFEVDVNAAEKILQAWLDKSFSNAVESEIWLNRFLLASKEWHPNRKRKTRTLFNGTFFSPRKKPADRAGQFVKDIMLYFVNISSGQIVV